MSNTSYTARGDRGKLIESRKGTLRVFPNFMLLYSLHQKNVCVVPIAEEAVFIAFRIDEMGKPDAPLASNKDGILNAQPKAHIGLCLATKLA